MEGDDNLLEKGKRLIDIPSLSGDLGLCVVKARRMGSQSLLKDPFTTGQIHQMKF
jgi:hypothetical protein